MQRIYLCLTFPWSTRLRRVAVGTPTPSLYILGGRPLLSLQPWRCPKGTEGLHLLISLVFQRAQMSPLSLASSCFLKTRLPQEPEVLGLRASLGLEAIFDLPLRELFPSPVGPPAQTQLSARGSGWRQRPATRTGLRNRGEGLSHYCVLRPLRGSEHCTISLL